MAEQEWYGKAAGWAWDRREEVARHLAQLYAWFRREQDASGEKRGILIIGPGGVGKSTLGGLLSGDFSFLNVPGDYEESIGVESYTLTDAPGVEITVPPGQKHRREATWAGLQQSIANGEYRGIILLAAYGYHTLGQISYRDHRLYHGNKAEFLSAYLEDRREEEINVVRNLMPYIRQCAARLWLLTVVTKQDLWWSDASAVEQHYHDGRYAAEIENALLQRDQRQLRHELLFASLVISRFATGKDELLASNVAGYDQKLQIASVRRLVEAVDALREWEAST